MFSVELSLVVLRDNVRQDGFARGLLDILHAAREREREREEEREGEAESDRQTERERGRKGGRPGGRERARAIV